MDREIKSKERTPLPVKLTYFLLVTPFFIYIPISILKIDIFLFSLDIAMLIALLFTIFNETALKRVFGGKVSILVFIIIYVISVVLRFALDLLSFNMQMITVLRNHLFGIGVFVVSSVWINTQQRINVIIRIFVWGGFLAAIYGLRQLLFGFMQFEVDRLALMGASLKEMQVLGRVRMTSSFGDPLVFGFYMMIGIFYYYIARQKKLLPSLTSKAHPVVLMLMVIGLLFSLTRAPLLGLICGGIFISIFSFRFTKRNLSVMLKILFGLVIVLFSLNELVTSKILADSDDLILKALNNGTKSFWSLYQMAMTTQENTYDTRMINLSKDSRLVAWEDGITYLVSNPFGAGLIDDSPFDFSVGDTGILSVGLRIGFVGLLAMVMIGFLVGFKSWIQIRSIPDLAYRRVAYIYLGMWVAIIITGAISSILVSSVLAVVIWTVAAILLNQGRIYRQEFLLTK